MCILIVSGSIFCNQLIIVMLAIQRGLCVPERAVLDLNI